MVLVDAEEDGVCLRSETRDQLSEKSLKRERQRNARADRMIASRYSLLLKASTLACTRSSTLVIVATQRMISPSASKIGRPSL